MGLAGLFAAPDACRGCSRRCARPGSTRPRRPAPRVCPMLGHRHGLGAKLLLLRLGDTLPRNQIRPISSSSWPRSRLRKPATCGSALASRCICCPSMVEALPASMSTAWRASRAPQRRGTSSCLRPVRASGGALFERGLAAGIRHHHRGRRQPHPGVSQVSTHM